MTLPGSIVYGIVYNTRDFGPNPTGVAGPYDSLNIALSTETDVTAGSDTNPRKIWQNSPYTSQYCDSGLAGTGSFRQDSPTCDYIYAPDVPAVQFKAGN